MSRERLGFLKSLQKGQPRIPEGKAEAAPVKTTKLIGNERIAYLSRVGEPCQTIVPKQVLEDGAGSLVPEVCLDLASLQGFTTRSAVAGGAASSSTGRGTGKRPHYDNRLRKLNAKFANRMAFLDLVAQSNFYFNEKVCLDRFEVWSQEKLGNIVSTQHVRHKMNGKSRRRIDSLWESSCRCSKACFRKLHSVTAELITFLGLFWGLTKLQQDVYVAWMQAPNRDLMSMASQFPGVGLARVGNGLGFHGFLPSPNSSRNSVV